MKYLSSKHLVTHCELEHDLAYNYSLDQACNTSMQTVLRSHGKPCDELNAAMQFRIAGQVQLIDELFELRTTAATATNIK